MKTWLKAMTAFWIVFLSGCASQQTASSEPPALKPIKGSVGSLGAPPPRKSIVKANGVTDGEKMTCKGLENAIGVRIGKLIVLKQAAKTESEKPAPTVERAFAPMFGPAGSDNKALGELATEQTQLEHYNSVLKTKGCAQVDLAAKIAAAPVPAPPTNPASVKPSANKM